MEPHINAKVWEKLPTPTLIEEQQRIAETLADTISRSETISLIISSREEQ
jgi:hypothetical protein